ncbi:PAS domain S-box protein [Neptuniibacter caesariensis]|uniref:histidine kinase n=1 Tax=Neptuniibacter caesariensis TaxID=207954 RepID=A0A7U8GU27_NEPCE|nr:PAS domain S-box protein [Neptuniibacter caesariensis]EAR62740.1 fusion protein of probable Na-dependent permease domain and histidine kinase domain of putative two-component sensor [Oceanospirillum sp. MED92] [Neptuniibacter caesariensis]
MLSTSTLLIALFLYIVALLLVAWLGQRGSEKARKLSDSPLIYTLSLAVFCTSWTFYGSVGKAATGGMSFLAIYFGPTLAMLFAWVMMRRLIFLKNELRITSIADLLAVRYFRSQKIATLVTVMVLVGAAPYISIQLKAINTSLSVLQTSPGVDIPQGFIDNLPLMVALSLGLFTILFGVRRLDPTERHPGIILALAFECVLKLVAFIAVGLFVCFSLFDSPVAMLKVASEVSVTTTENLIKTPDFFQWTTLLLLSASAFFFLPRQFHVAVVENSSPQHFKTAQWGFPLYIFLINLFVIPIALAGLLLGYQPEQADSFVLLLPLEHGDPGLALFAFIGGVSAAIGMVMICAIALSTMLVNHLLLPVIERLPALGLLKRYLLQLRWVAVFIVVLGGHLFNALVGGSYMLVNIGLISFAAVAQFAPATLGGLFWRKGTLNGALLGLSLGFCFWIYCLVVPTFVRSGWIDAGLLSDGLLGISWLRPEALFNLNALDWLSHGVFWSLAFNFIGYVVGSLYSRPGVEERNYYLQFMDKMDADKAEEEQESEAGLEDDIPLDGKRELLLHLLCQYMSANRASEVLRDAELHAKTSGKASCNLFALAELGRQIDQRLSGALGASVAAKVLERSELLSSSERKRLESHYSRVLADLQISPVELKRKINFYRERQNMVLKHSEEQAKTIEQLQQEISLREKAEVEKQQSQNRLQLIMELAPTSIYLIRSDGRFLEVNNEFLKLYGVKKEQVIGHLPQDFMAADEANSLIEKQHQVLSERRQFSFVENFGSDQSRTYMSYKFPVLDGEELVGLCGISTDISDRIRLENELKAFSLELEQKVEERTEELQKSNASLACTLDDLKQTQRQLVDAEKMVALASLVTGVAHEINTPLGNCVTASSSIQHDLDNLIEAEKSKRLSQNLFHDFCESAASQMGLINANLERAVALVHSFRNLSAHEGDTEMKEIDLCKFIAQFAMAYRSDIEMRGADFEVSCQDSSPFKVNTFPSSLTNALEYLVDNSLTHAFLDGQRGVISIQVNHTDTGAEIIYADNGMGLDSQMEKHLFEPFITSKRCDGRLGLGAHVFYLIVTQKLGGQITVNNKPGEGLALHIYIPYGFNYSKSKTEHPILHEL